jgi:hypothetical protein
MALQDDINQFAADISRATDEIKAEITDLEAQIAAGTAVDTTALRAAVQSLDDVAPPVVTEPPVV